MQSSRKNNTENSNCATYNTVAHTEVCEPLFLIKHSGSTEKSVRSAGDTR